MGDRFGSRTSTAGAASPVAGAAVPAAVTAEPAIPLAGTARGALVERARAGDRAAFETLLERWLGPAFHTALAILGNEADARDATQDAFLQCWRELPRLHDPERFDAWLSRILVNACRGVRRSRNRVAVREIDLGSLPPRAEPATGFETAWGERPGSLDAMEHAFERLDTPQRAILVLHHLEHRPLQEIAATLGIPVGTAKSRLFHARRALERALEVEQR